MATRYQTVPPVARSQQPIHSLFTSDLWLTALRVGEELLGELEMQSQARAMRIESANNLNSQLWNGRYYNIYFDPSNPLSSPDQPYLLGNLPGERLPFP